MKKFSKISFLMILAIMVVLSACGTNEASSGEATGDSEGEEVKTLKAVTNAAYAPMEYMDGDKVVGFDVDFIKAVAEEAGYEVEVAHTGWDSMFVEIDEEISDLAIAAITITDERKESYDFSVPYYASSNMILVPEGSDVKSAADLADKTISVQNGTTGQEAAEAILGENSESIKKFEDINLAILELMNGGAEAVIADKPVLEGYVKNNPDQNLQLIEDDSFTADYLGIMFPKGSELKADFDEAVNSLFESGKYEEIYTEWFGGEPDVEDLKANQ